MEMSVNNKIGRGEHTTRSPASHNCNKKKKSSNHDNDEKLRSFIISTNYDMIAITLILAIYHASTTSVYAAEEEQHSEISAGGHGSSSQSTEEVIENEESEVYAVLFPWFAEIIGVFVYYILSRYLHAIPYTAIMFLIGAFIGMTVQRLDNAIAKSALTWVGIEGEVILLVFLPGLLFLDSYNIDVHLFISSFAQLLTFAFPMVLAGTTLTALVACYLFDYGWSFDLCMTFGSILAATDPVAVAVLLNELGAPPRLKMHVSGESLMNDGSAVVFYHIFSLRFFYEMGIPGVGEDVDWTQGFALFFRLSLGGACIGVAFGLGLLVVLYNLNRRLSGEDSVIQVVATISVAYLVFFTSEILAGCSGIIAVLFCGVTTKAFGETFYNDSHLSIHFWEITESLLNTLLFTLGGCVWGDIMSTEAYTGDAMFVFSAKDWGYLFMLFIFVIAIRFFLVFAFYPCTSRIGIGQSIREAIFMSYGGLRGAVGIALALSLHAEVIHLASADDFDELKGLEYRSMSAKLFGLVGGIAFLTLIILAPTSGPLLKKLGLVTPSETRKKVVAVLAKAMKQYVLHEYIALLTEERFHDVDFTVVKDHIPILADINYEQVMAAVRHHRESSPEKTYKKPNLKNVIPYLYRPGDNTTNVKHGSDDDAIPTNVKRSIGIERSKSRRHSAKRIRQTTGNRGTVFDLGATYSEHYVQEERLVFVKILRSSYKRLFEHGQLESRGFLVHSIDQSLEYAESAASRGLPLADWNALEVASDSFARPAETALRLIFSSLAQKSRPDFDRDFIIVNFKVRQILVFIHAHQWARKIFKGEFSKGYHGTLTEAEKTVMDESEAQVELANEALAQLNETDVVIVKSHYVCQILLNRAAYYLRKLNKHGLLSEREAGHYLEEIEESLMHVKECKEVYHSDEMDSEHKMRRISQAPAKDLHSWNLFDEVSRRHLTVSNEEPEEAVKGKVDKLPHISEAEKEDKEENDGRAVSFMANVDFQL